MIDMTLDNSKVTIGLDLGDRLSRTYEVAANGTRQAEGMVATTPVGLQRYFGGRATCRVVLEASTHSPWVSRELAALGHEVIVANPAAMFRGAPRRRRRNDALDAELLARQGRADVRLLYPVTHRGLLAQQHLEVLRARDQLVRTRSQLITHVRCAVKVTGTRVRASSAPAFVAIASTAIPAELRAATAPVLSIITALTQQIREADRRIAQVIRDHYPVAQRLQQISGVGPITALAFVLLVDDPTRFTDSRDVGAYFGLVPRLDESSDSQPQLRITKSGTDWGGGCWSPRRIISWGPSVPTAICGGTVSRSRRAVGRTRRSGRSSRSRASSPCSCITCG